MSWDMEADVIIVGGGGAGLAAAVAAADSRARTIVLEKTAAVGGTTGLAIGSVTAAGTPMQIEAGIADTPQAHDEDVAKFAPHMESQNNAPLRKCFLEHAAETFTWLSTLGVKFAGPREEPPNRVARMHNVTQGTRRGLIAVLSEQAERRGVKVLTGRRVSRLIVSESGEVIGVEAQHLEADGSERLERYAAQCGVILAAGDYSANPALKERYLKRLANLDPVNPASTGDGHLLAIELGAATANMEIAGPALRFSPRSANEPNQSTISAAPEMDEQPDLAAIFGGTWLGPERAIFASGAMCVNSEGQRFADELAHPDFTIAASRQQGNRVYVIFDHKVAETFTSWPHFLCTAPNVAYAYVQDLREFRQDIFIERPTSEALAEQIGCDPHNLRATLDAYNALTQGGAADPCGRQQFAAPLDTPPYYCMGPAKAVIPTTKGGLRINLSMEVIGDDGQPIPRLYAAGSTGLGGMVLNGHGLMISWASTSGRLAGQNAAQRQPVPQR